MASMQIPCPECGSILKLPDRSLLGKKGRCPSCRHTFVLAEPEEVELELAELPAEETPRQGTSARWVADESDSAAPGGGHDVDQPVEVAGEARTIPSGADSPEKGGGGFPVFEDSAATTPSRKVKRRSRSPKASRQQKKRSRGGPSLAVIVGSSIVVLAVIGVGVTWFRSGTDAAAKAAVDDVTVASAETTSGPAAADPETQTLRLPMLGKQLAPSVSIWCRLV